MENNYENFLQEYNLFQANREILRNRIFDNFENEIELERLQRIFYEYQNLDVKIRLAFGIREIRLNNFFVSDKENDLKLCHLLYYKLADLWFAYETYIKFYTETVGASKNKIEWIDSIIHLNYAQSIEISHSLELIQEKLSEIYSIQAKRELLIEYLNYSLENSIHGQRRRLIEIIEKVENSQFNLTNNEILTIIYAVRNNFVHNGETTVVPEIFGYQNKVELLKILYPYLAVFTLKISNLTFARV
ncbi:hypothetical protein [Flavobacterium sp. UBA7680]|uniref:hypothetical protein n=1 Tax=Flavobacterium sp. UBA7680 TaxID=1946559 RepID=UPI0025C4227C|nr:hypothetical protein [Flavobacterium sp. UBA7680]